MQKWQWAKYYAIQNKFIADHKDLAKFKSVPGIYIFKRSDELGQYAYIGQAKNLLDRIFGHYKFSYGIKGSSQHIDLSLFKHKNEWKLKVFSLESLNAINKTNKTLDEWETEIIQKYLSMGIDLYNVSGGGQGKNRVENINDARVASNAKRKKQYYNAGIYDALKDFVKVFEFNEKTISFNIKPECFNKDYTINKKSVKAIETFLKNYKKGVKKWK